jgi:hypothetical protein
MCSTIETSVVCLSRMLQTNIVSCIHDENCNTKVWYLFRYDQVEAASGSTLPSDWYGHIDNDDGPFLMKS